MKQYLSHYINNEWVDSESSQIMKISSNEIEVVSPYSQKVVGSVIIGTELDVARATTAAKQAFLSENWSNTSPEERAAYLQKILEAIHERTQDLAFAMHEEMGCPLPFAAEKQMRPAYMAFENAIDALRGSVKSSLGLVSPISFEEKVSTNTITTQVPIGCCAMIVPWNWPLMAICCKLAPALAAGCTVVLKPSEYCPGAAVILAECIAEAQLPAGVFNLVHGDAETGNFLTLSRNVDLVSFTGSTKVGKTIAQNCAVSMKRTLLELGGNAANIILPETDLQAHLTNTLEGILCNSGQNCVAATRVLVHHDQIHEAELFIVNTFSNTCKAEFISKLTKDGRKVVNAETKTDPSNPVLEYGPLVNKKQYDHVRALVNSAYAEGAKLLLGNASDVESPKPEDASFNNNDLFFTPTVLTNVNPNMKIAKEEIFGPVALIIAYRTIEEAVQIANGTEYGLSNIITCNDARVPDAMAIARRLDSGIVTINSSHPDLNAPFGGMKQSGIGREGGRKALLEFMQPKSITVENEETFSEKALKEAKRIIGMDLSF